MQRFSYAMYVVCQRLQSITNVTSNVERIFEVLDTENEIAEKMDAKELVVTGQIPSLLPQCTLHPLPPV